MCLQSSPQQDTAEPPRRWKPSDITFRTSSFGNPSGLAGWAVHQTCRAVQGGLSKTTCRAVPQTESSNLSRPIGIRSWVLWCHETRTECWHEAGAFIENSDPSGPQSKPLESTHYPELLKLATCYCSVTPCKWWTSP